ncbi:MAG: hypothetical protein NTV02_03790 [Candidatus Zambryskibacteria bacterium]|nr:hypothetical protein [Candidatus Zambryskibacteria bacterium]
MNNQQYSNQEEAGVLGVLVMRLGLAKDAQQAKTVLFFIAVVVFAITFVLAYQNFKTTSSTVSQEQIDKAFKNAPTSQR